MRQKSRIQHRVSTIADGLACVGIPKTPIFGQALVKQVKGRGMMQGIEFADPVAAAQVSQVAFSEFSLIVETCGRNGEVLKLMPPLTTDRSVLEEGLGALSRAVARVATSIDRICEGNVEVERSPCCKVRFLP